jgi:hypothetical protein
MKAGFSGSALILAIASSSVPRAFGLAGLSNPTWLSLICAKVSPRVSGGPGFSDEADGMGHAAGNRPQHPGADPGHAFQNLAAIGAVITIKFAHCQSPLSRPPRETGAVFGLSGRRPGEGAIYSRRPEEIFAVREA